MLPQQAGLPKLCRPTTLVFVSLLVLLLILLPRLLQLLPRLLAVRFGARLRQFLLGIAHGLAVLLQVLDIGAGGVARELGGGVGIAGGRRGAVG